MRDDRDLARALRRDLDRVRLPDEGTWLPAEQPRRAAWPAVAVAAAVAVLIVATIVGVALEARQAARPEPVATAIPSATASAAASASAGPPRTIVPDLGYSIVLREGWRRSDLLSARTGDPLQPGHDLYTKRSIDDERANAGGETGGPSWLWALLVEVERNRDGLTLRQWVDEGHVGFSTGQRVEDAIVAGRPGLNVVDGTRGEVNYLVAREDLVYSLSYRAQGSAPAGATKADLDAMIASVQLLDTTALPTPSSTPNASAHVSTVAGIQSFPLGELKGEWTFVSRLRFDLSTVQLELWAVEVFGDRRLLALTYEEPRALTQTSIRRQLSPDGKRIVLSTPTQPSSSAGYRLTIVDLATGRTTILTDGAQRDTFPAWSPDGRSVAFLRSNAKGDDTAIWRISTDGKALDGPLTTKGALAIYGWSASGTYLAYASDLSTLSVLNVAARTASVLGQKFTGYFDVPIDYRQPTAAFPPELVVALTTETEALLDIATAEGGTKDVIVREPKPVQIGEMFRDPRWRPGSPTFLYRVGYQVFTNATTPSFKVPLQGRVLRAEWAYGGNSIAYIVDGPAGLEHGASVRIALADGGNDRTLFVPPPAGDASDLEDLATVDYR